MLSGKSKTKKENKDLWATPLDTFLGAQAYLNYRFTLDACASAHNKKCENYLSEEQNMLTCDWGKPNQFVWINPPYSNPLPFIERAIEQSKTNGHIVVMLLPADLTVKWFSVCLAHASRIIFITGNEKGGGRISFINNETGKKGTGNNKGSMLVEFTPNHMDNRPKTLYVSRQELQKLAHKENWHEK